MSFRDPFVRSRRRPQAVRIEERPKSPGLRDWAGVLLVIGLVLIFSGVLTASAAVNPALSVSPGQAAPGSRVAVSGTGFPASAELTLLWDGSDPGWSTAVARSTGTFTAFITVPDAVPGAHTLAAVDGSSRTSLAFTVVPPREVASVTPPFAEAAPTAVPIATMPTAAPAVVPVAASSTIAPTATPTIVEGRGALRTGAFNGVMAGVWDPSVTLDMSGVRLLQQSTRKPFTIAMWFQSWSDSSLPFRGALANADANGSIPMITWEPWDPELSTTQSEFPLRSIANGSYDGYIRRWATAIKSYDKPIFLRFAQEMNQSVVNSWGVGMKGNTAADYVAAWRHIHDVFQSVGATNALFVWCPTVQFSPETAFAPYYPGDDYVDWVALDGYNGGPLLPYGGWTPAAQIFGPSYDSLRALSSKPMMIGETGSVEQGGNKASWVADLLGSQLPSRFPAVKAIIWFNQKTTVDWRLQSSQASLAAFASAYGSSYYRTTPPPE